MSSEGEDSSEDNAYLQWRKQNIQRNKAVMQILDLEQAPLLVPDHAGGRWKKSGKKRKETNPDADGGSPIKTRSAASKSSEGTERRDAGRQEAFNASSHTKEKVASNIPVKTEIDPSPSPVSPSAEDLERATFKRSGGQAEEAMVEPESKRFCGVPVATNPRPVYRTVKRGVLWRHQPDDGSTRDWETELPAQVLLRVQPSATQLLEQPKKLWLAPAVEIEDSDSSDSRTAVANADRHDSTKAQQGGHAARRKTNLCSSVWIHPPHTGSEGSISDEPAEIPANCILRPAVPFSSCASLGGTSEVENKLQVTAEMYTKVVRPGDADHMENIDWG